MRVALVTNLYPPIQTGTAHWTRELAQHLSDAGHEVTVVTCGSNKRAVSEQDGAVMVYRLPSWRIPSSRLLLGFDQFYFTATPANRRRLREIFTARHIELVHQCGHLLDLTYATAAVARKLGIPALCSIHTQIHSPGSRVLDAMMRFVDGTFVRHLAIRRYDALIALDGQMRTYAEARYGHSRIRTVLVSVDDDVLNRPPVGDPPSGSFRILSVGHVTAMRSRLDLIAAVSRLHQEGYPVQLVIVGKLCDRRPERTVESLGLRGVVTFTGELPRAEVFDLARTCHMEAHWITVPGLGSATLEAMALGLPVMAWAPPGLYDAVPLVDGVNLLLAAPGDVGQIAHAIRRLIIDPQLRKDIGEAGRRLVLRNLSWSAAIERIQAVYGELATDQPILASVPAAI